MKNIILIIIVLIVLGVIYYYQDLRTNLFTTLIVNRGILAPNCTWWTLSENLLKDASAIDLYYELKKKYGSFVRTNFGGRTVYLVTDPKYIKTILRYSPDLFGVGQLKYNMFMSFMPKNVGVETG